MVSTTMERRVAPFTDLEVREGDDGLLHFTGYAAVFDSVSHGERVARTAFDKTLNDGADVRFTYNHDPDSVMARSGAGDLRLSTDERGLKVEADLNPEDTDVQRIAPKLRAGHLTQMSFAFTPVLEGRDEDGTRVLKEVRLSDVAPVTYPWYEDTEAELRDKRELLRHYADDLGVDLLIPIPEPPTDPDAEEAARAEETPPEDHHGANSPEHLRMRLAVNRNRLRQKGLT